MVRRDEETNEIIREYRDKKKRKRVTALKKAILEKRKAEKERRHQGKQETNEESKAPETDYETMYETDFKPEADEEDGRGHVKLPRYSSEKEFLAYKDAFKPLFSETLNNPQKNHHFYLKLQNEMLDLKDEFPEQDDEVRDYESLIEFQNLHGFTKQELKYNKLREYVDMHQTPELQHQVRSLLYKLKELYFIRKTKPQKGKYKKHDLAPKKRYMIGLKEIMKNLFAGNLTMVIVATNVERVEGDGGLDDALHQIVQECRK